jgi:hypothetical protein
MIRASVMANDSMVVDAIAALLAKEIAVDVLQLTYSLSHNMNEYIRDHNSVLIMIDDGETSNALQPAPRSDQKDGPLLLMEASLKVINLHIYHGYQLTGPRMEQVTNLVRDFSRSYLKDIKEQVATWAL